MNRRKNMGVVDMKVIDPKYLTKMKDDEIIIVNRVQISSKIVEYEIKNVNSSNSLLLKHAFKNMKDKEKKSNNIVFGAKMQVKDVRVIFPEYESFPKNSFLFAIK